MRHLGAGSGGDLDACAGPRGRCRGRGPAAARAGTGSGRGPACTPTAAWCSTRSSGPSRRCWPRREPQAGRAPACGRCGRTAARAHGLLLIDDDDPVTSAREHLLDEVAVPGPRPAVAWRRTDGCCDGGELALSERGPGPAGRSGLVAHLEGPDRARLRRAADAGGATSACSTTSCTAVWSPARRCSSGRRGRAAAGLARRLRRGLALADDRSESPGETLARLLLLPVLPGLVPQVRVFDRGQPPRRPVRPGRRALAGWPSRWTGGTGTPAT